MKIVVTGGRQKKSFPGQKEWSLYQMGVIVTYDETIKHIQEDIHYVTPPEARPEKNYSVLFKSGAVHGQNLYVCTQTEILVYTLPGFVQTHYISLPYFNDLHHVTLAHNGHLLVANTGLDMVAEITQSGETVNIWNTLFKNPWVRFTPEVDYRHVLTTKPHQSHPNYVFQTQDDEIWATRFEQKDAICLTQPHKKIAIDIERPHDGVVIGHHVYFTTVDGHIVIANWQSQQIEQVVDLNVIVDREQPLGWCRGLTLIDDEYVVVGFSRIRQTKYHQNLNWLRNRLGQSIHTVTLPTRIAAYHLREKTLLWEMDMESVGINAIFSIHVLSNM